MKSDRATDPAVKRPARSFVVTTPTADKVSGNTSSAQDRRYKSTPSITPGHDDVLAAAVSLYADELKPFGRILRKRIAEQAAARTNSSPADSLPDVDMKHLIKVCASSPQLRIMNEEGGDWSAVIVGRAQQFVNVYSPTDIYPQALWDQARTYFESVSPEEMKLPGGRYSCAQALMERKLPFLANRSLGQVCHIVQLAISQKRILGYYSGAVVPYSCSQSMVKEWCAYKGAHCTSQGPTGLTAGPFPLAKWDEARIYLRLILQNAATPQGPGMIPLSNVKRLFRSHFQVELSETVLGYSKLSELLQDRRFKDICTVQLQGHGYIVMQNTQPSSNVSVSLSLVEAPPSNGVDESTHLAKEPARVQLHSSSPLRRNRERVDSDTNSAEAIEPQSPTVPYTLWPATPDLSPVRSAYRSPTRSSVARPFFPILLEAQGADAAVEHDEAARGGQDGRLRTEVVRSFSSSPTRKNSIRSPNPRSMSSKFLADDSISRWPWSCSTDGPSDPQDKMKKCYSDGMESPTDTSTCYPSPCARMGYSPGRSSRHSNGDVTSPSPHDEPMKISLGRDVDYAAKEAQELKADHKRSESPRVRPRLKFMLDERRPSIVKREFLPCESFGMEDVVSTPLRSAHRQQETRARLSALSPSILKKDGLIGSMEYIESPDVESMGRSHSVPRTFGSSKDNFANACRTFGYRPQPVIFPGSPTLAVAAAHANMSGGPFLEFTQMPAPIWPPGSSCVRGGANWCAATSSAASPTESASQQVLHLSELI
mmetsp:Transcript_25025/g.69735  ORF Transcript_25025/g.69735 Transcript_25025/m.69735 type:complete len:767 (+) Transcript_25025:47-2347(+)